MNKDVKGLIKYLFIMFLAVILFLPALIALVVASVSFISIFNPKVLYSIDYSLNYPNETISFFVSGVIFSLIVFAYFSLTIQSTIKAYRTHWSKYLDWFFNHVFVMLIPYSIALSLICITLSLEHYIFVFLFSCLFIPSYTLIYLAVIYCKFRKIKNKGCCNISKIDEFGKSVSYENKSKKISFKPFNDWFLSGLMYFSLLICVLVYISLLIINQEAAFVGLKILFPPIVIYLVCYIANKILTKYPYYKKNIHCTLHIFSILLVAFFVFSNAALFNRDMQINNPDIFGDYGTRNIADYGLMFQSVSNSDKIRYFPKTIPSGARNVEFYLRNSNFLVNKEMYVSFDIDKKYIDNEIKKYKFVKIEGPFYDEMKYNPAFYHFKTRDSIQATYKVHYIVMEKEGEGIHYLNNVGGIATSGNRILYFYSSLEN